MYGFSAASSVWDTHIQPLKFWQSQLREFRIVRETFAFVSRLLGPVECCVSHGYAYELWTKFALKPLINWYVVFPLFYIFFLILIFGRVLFKCDICNTLLSCRTADGSPPMTAIRLINPLRHYCVALGGRKLVLNLFRRYFASFFFPMRFGPPHTCFALSTYKSTQ